MQLARFSEGTIWENKVSWGTIRRSMANLIGPLKTKWDDGGPNRVIGDDMVWGMTMGFEEF